MNPLKTVLQKIKKINVWIFAVMAITLTGLLVYSNTFSVPFVLDDRRNIIQDPTIRDVTNIKAVWNYVPTRFIPKLTFAINYRLSGLDVTNYHIANFTIHILTTLAVWWFLTILIKRRSFIPVVSAALFLIHPVQTETVIYITQRCASLAALFYILTLIFYLKSESVKSHSQNVSNSKSIFFYIISIFTLVLGLFSKENAFSLPVTIILVHVFFVSQKEKFKSIFSVKIISYFLVVACVAVWVFTTPEIISRLYGNGGKSEIPQTTYLITQINVVRTYLRLLVFPINQNFDYDYPLTSSILNFHTVISLVLHSVLLSISFILRKRNRLLSFGILFFYITLSIESTFVLNDVIKEHALYLPSIGFFIAVSSLSIWIYRVIDNSIRRDNFRLIYKYFCLFLLFSLLFLYGFISYKRTLVWQSETMLWKDTVQKSPTKDRPRIQLGVTYLLNGDLEQAKIQFEQLIKNNPKNIVAYSNLSVIYTNEGNFDKADQLLKTALTVDNTSQMLWQNLGYLYEKKGENKLAIQTYQDGIANKSNTSLDMAITYLNLGTLYLKQDEWQLAFDQFEQAVKISPDLARAHYSLGLTYLHFGNKEEAKREFLETLRLDPNYQQVKIYLEKLK